MRTFSFVSPSRHVIMSARSCLACGEAMDLTTGYVNCMWLDDMLELMMASTKLCTVPARA